MKFRLLTLLFLANLFALPLRAQSLSNREQVKTAQEELTGFTLPDGFIIELVASEKDGIANPIDLTFDDRSEEHTSELQSLMRISYAVFCLKNKTKQHTICTNNTYKILTF